MTKDPFLAMKAKETSQIVRSLVFCHLVILQCQLRIVHQYEILLKYIIFKKMEPIQKSHTVG